MDKLTMAHQMALAIQGTKLLHDMELVSEMAWKYADAMQAEADKRNKAESQEKRKQMRELLNACNTFIEKEGQHFDDVEWQPDWSQAPDWANWWALDKDFIANWFDGKPSVDSGYLSFGEAIQCDLSPSFNYQGAWQDSLRKRPK